MKSFRMIALEETYVNLYSDKDKETYIDEIWDLLIRSYEDIGGIKGSGFNSKKDMINKIHLWKIFTENKVIKAGILYKDKKMRKSVALFTDGSSKGKNKLKEMLKEDFKRSMIEVSHSLLKFIEKNMSTLVKQYAIPSKDVSDIIKKEIEITLLIGKTMF